MLQCVSSLYRSVVSGAVYPRLSSAVLEQVRALLANQVPLDTCSVLTGLESADTIVSILDILLYNSLLNSPNTMSYLYTEHSSLIFL